ncbi:uncharacterized protein [Venturia canescens]|uniref:uncharacterized protein isoform X2 n=1 Tax=Venturia canescens TaxID=32260 RepID=UPI001C9D2D4B|nr:uncharacterized protein LOC122419574 isoform X2 [Venturia canescens]XP_043270123.1 uncharacterized protein LOC122407771 isoform X2 [Venturia canescens]XP_043270124.1 uncharacterized protein LOC122407771 isoform X2 [Venturia canescens]XP_043277067.1 uncharacterized protein LOC122411971 isoform X2 [Venturia canescens]XP_043277068.1 uncharacterized protein LOC122411971 isoform X2 [Venturia canescens]XP_043290198.1 uncharacterized protein LOC122419574 isoform X2 [Venturia canescens]
MGMSKSSTLEGTASTVEEPFPGGREVIVRAFQARHIPEEALHLMVSSLRLSSLKQYDCALRKWWNFCRRKKINPFQPSMEEVIEILAEEFKGGAAHGSLNSLRSAISLVVGPHVGQDFHIRRLFKGISELRPSRPKYDHTWDPKVVLDYFDKLDDNENMPLGLLSGKLITLLALITGQRMQTLSLIKLQNIERSQDVVQVKIPDIIKTSGRNRSQPLLLLPKYEINEKICVVRTLDNYLQRTDRIRGQVDSLFVSLKKPIREVSAGTLAKWTKNVLKASGVDTQVFSAHSTRHASTSAAKQKGLGIDSIRKAAGWSEKSKTFARFYDLPVVPDNTAFANAIYEKAVLF